MQGWVSGSAVLLAVWTEEHELGSAEGTHDSNYPQDYAAPVPVPAFQEVEC